MIMRTEHEIYLVRYGAVPEVARFVCESEAVPTRGANVVVETDRGLQLGTTLDRLKPGNTPADSDEVQFKLVRIADDTDLRSAHEHAVECEQEFADWCSRIEKWELNLELIDIEWTLDHSKRILYVLCERGPDSTKLALQAAASGFGIIEVQPVSKDGLISIPSGSCGSGGGGCGCHH
jgi:cell fate regulator YaaT (PSP1 superfamily)